jgi:hypothetical protein
MKENQRILSEAFFKKEGYYDKLKRTLPQYEPSDTRKRPGKPGVGSILSFNKNPKTGQSFISVTDTEEAKKRLVSSIGASIGINSVKNMASRSIKSFPVVISDNIEPETAVMLKRLMEEQYAEYINLLISNQVIDISAFKTSEDGNIAIQALDVISGDNFGKQNLSKKMLKGDFSVDSADEYFMGISPLYNLIRNESKEYKAGNSLLDGLLENSMIVPAEQLDDLLEFYSIFNDDIMSLTEAVITPSRTDRDGQASETDPKTTKKYETLSNFLSGQAQKLDTSSIKNREEIFNIARGAKEVTVDGETKNVFKKLTSTDVVVDTSQMKDAMDSSLAELLLNPRNEAIKDRFEKATFLLQANRISGAEYIEYLIQRLGIPISQSTRSKLVTIWRGPNYMTSNIKGGITRRDMKLIEKNRLIIRKNIPQILQTSGGSILNAALAGVLAGGITQASGAGTALAGSSLVSLLGLAGPLAVLAPALPLAVGGAVFAAMTAVYIKKAITKMRRASQIEGWERVESLIVSMEEQQRDLRNLGKRLDVEAQSEEESEINDVLTPKELDTELADYSKEINLMLKGIKSKTVFTEKHKAEINFNQEILVEAETAGRHIFASLLDDKEFSSNLAEAMIVSTTEPIKIIKRYEFDPKKKPELMVVPEFTTRSTYGYGEVEYDKKELKDRKYNAPLVMTVRFKERMSDGKFTDNELVAVIGILGVITRIPSEEMKYILEANIQGNTLKGFLQGDSSSSGLVSNLLGVTKIKKDIENLPVSVEVWNNLEKVSKLILSNKISGKQTNNIANAHIVFSQKEIDEVKNDTGVDYLKDKSLVESLMKRYSAFTVMVANDAGERLYIYDDPDNISWNVIPYSAIRNKDTGDQLTAALTKMSRGM